jgi:hypothetical protein
VLLGNGRKHVNNTRAIARQLLGKEVPAEMNMHATLQLPFLCSPLLGLGRFFSFLTLYTGGRSPWTWDQPVARPLPTRRTTQTE